MTDIVAGVNLQLAMATDDDLWMICHGQQILGCGREEV